MKRPLPVIFFLFAGMIWCNQSGAQNRLEIMKSIREEFNAINRDKSLIRFKLDCEEISEQVPDGGCSLTGFYKNEQVKKIYQWTGLSNGIEIREFYFKNGRLIFVYEKFSSFIYDTLKQETDFSRTIPRFEGRYYFNRNKLINTATTGHDRFEADGISREQRLLEYANETLFVLAKKKRTPDRPVKRAD